MSGYWSVTNRPAAGSPASATRAAASAALNGGQVNRLRSLTATLNGTSVGTDQLVVRDGASGVGTIIWQADLAINATVSTESIFLADLDLRASPGNALTIEFVNGVAGDRESVNGYGDYVPIGWPIGMP